MFAFTLGREGGSYILRCEGGEVCDIFLPNPSHKCRGAEMGVRASGGYHVIHSHQPLYSLLQTPIYSPNSLPKHIAQQQSYNRAKHIVCRLLPHAYVRVKLAEAKQESAEKTVKELRDEMARAAAERDGSRQSNKARRHRHRATFPSLSPVTVAAMLSPPLPLTTTPSYHRSHYNPPTPHPSRSTHSSRSFPDV